jgi:hypothetical protein
VVRLFVLFNLLSINVQSTLLNDPVALAYLVSSLQRKRFWGPTVGRDDVEIFQETRNGPPEKGISSNFDGHPLITLKSPNHGLDMIPCLLGRIKRRRLRDASLRDLHTMDQRNKFLSQHSLSETVFWFRSVFH